MLRLFKHCIIADGVNVSPWESHAHLSRKACTCAECCDGGDYGTDEARQDWDEAKDYTLEVWQSAAPAALRRPLAKDDGESDWQTDHEEEDQHGRTRAGESSEEERVAPPQLQSTTTVFLETIERMHPGGECTLMHALEEEVPPHANGMGLAKCSVCRRGAWGGESMYHCTGVLQAAHQGQSQCSDEEPQSPCGYYECHECYAEGNTNDDFQGHSGLAKRQNLLYQTERAAVNQLTLNQRGQVHAVITAEGFPVLLEDLASALRCSLSKDALVHHYVVHKGFEPVEVRVEPDERRKRARRSNSPPPQMVVSLPGMVRGHKVGYYDYPLYKEDLVPLPKLEGPPGGLDPRQGSDPNQNRPVDKDGLFLRETADESSYRRQETRNPRQGKGKGKGSSAPCHQFQAGTCSYGARCHFSHNQNRSGAGDWEEWDHYSGHRASDRGSRRARR